MSITVNPGSGRRSKREKTAGMQSAIPHFMRCMEVLTDESAEMRKFESAGFKAELSVENVRPLILWNANAMPIYLVIHNDEEHSMEYVVNILERELGMRHANAVLITREIDLVERASIEVPDVFTAERLREAILRYGKDRKMAASTGPLAVSISDQPDPLYAGVFANGAFTLRPDFIERYRGKRNELVKLRIQRHNLYLRAYVERSVKSWFRIHLLTAIVMMLTMGIILGLNLRTQQLRRLDPLLDNRVYARGFPMRVQTWFAIADGSEQQIETSGDICKFDGELIAPIGAYWRDSEVIVIEKTKFMHWIVNVTAALLSLYVIAYPVEVMLRNRDRKDALRHPKIE